MAPAIKLWPAVVAICALDAEMFSNIASFIRQNGYGGWCGTWMLVIDAKMITLGLMSLPVGYYTIRSYRIARERLSSRLRLVARLPLCCMAALLLTYFVAFPVMFYLYRY